MAVMVESIFCDVTTCSLVYRTDFCHSWTDITAMSVAEIGQIPCAATSFSYRHRYMQQIFFASFVNFHP